jgi:peptidoglycan/LPS O-acetylase OafA/YrhL
METGGHTIGALWSVSVEVQFYLIAPFIALVAISLFTNKLRCIAFFVISSLLFMFLKFNMYNSEVFVTRAYGLFLPNLDCFLSGAAVACLVRLWKQKQKPIRFGFQYGIGILLLLQPAISVWEFHLSGPIRAYLLSIGPGITAIAVGIVIFLWEVAPESARLAETSFGRMTRFTAKLTYCLYVVHEPVLTIARKLYPYPVTLLQAICLLPLGLLVTFIVASGLYYSVELPFDRMKSQHGWSPDLAERYLRAKSVVFARLI